MCNITNIPHNHITHYASHQTHRPKHCNLSPPSHNFTSETIPAYVLHKRANITQRIASHHNPSNKVHHIANKSHSSHYTSHSTTSQSTLHHTHSTPHHQTHGIIHIPLHHTIKHIASYTSNPTASQNTLYHTLSITSHCTIPISLHITKHTAPYSSHSTSQNILHHTHSTLPHHKTHCIIHIPLHITSHHISHLRPWVARAGQGDVVRRNPTGLY